MIDRGQGRQQVAWDIETTGFAWSDQITVSGFWLPNNTAELIINTNGTTLERSTVEKRLTDSSGGVSVSVTTAADENELLRSMQEFLFERFDTQYNRLIAFNAESWKGGFDLPFLRTRCIKHDTEWVFDGLHFADLWEPLKKRLNTTHVAFGGSTSINSLTGAHELLLDDPHTTISPDTDETMEHSWYQDVQYDPFEDSGEAVACYNRNNLFPILQHNLADVHRTWEIGELVRAFVSSKDITTKKL